MKKFLKFDESQKRSDIKILILILSSEDPINLRDEQAQRATWAKDHLECRVIWIKGDISKGEYFEPENRILYLDLEEKTSNILRKTILAIRWAMAQDWKPDIIVRSNVSTYFNIDKLIKKCKRVFFQEDKPYVAGYFDRHKENYIGQTPKKDFASGAGIFLNEMAIESLLNIDVQEFENIPDDVAISMYLLKNNVIPASFSRCNIHITGIFLNTAYLRVKSSTDSTLASKRMAMIHEFNVEERLFFRIKKLIKLYVSELRSLMASKNRRRSYFRMILSLFLNNLRNLVIARNYE